MADWQPIKTAPRDGQPILVCDNTKLGGNQQVVFWDLEKLDEDVYGWCTSDGPTFHEQAFTHWMPLPETPHE